MKNLTFPAKSVGEAYPITVSFVDVLQGAETINGASCSVLVSSGTDASPSSMLSGAITFTTTTVTQVIQGGIAGVIYILVFTVTATGSHNYVKIGRQAVLVDGNNF